MTTYQPGILAGVPRAARYLTFGLRPGEDPRPSIAALAQMNIDESIIVGLGLSTVSSMRKSVPGLRTFPEHAGAGVEVPSTPGALWVCLRGEDRGELLHRGRRIEATVFEGFELRHVVDGFRYGKSRDLTGYEDGTENPTGEDAVRAAIADDGSSYVAVQQWVHDLDTFLSWDESDQDKAFGRHKKTNEEFDAPASAHVKRAAMESFEPEAFLVRRSMPWSEGHQEGLVFIAYGKSFDAFEVILRRMTGNDDGIPDALFRFTRPISGAFFWCPPVRGNQLDLRRLLE